MPLVPGILLCQPWKHSAGFAAVSSASEVVAAQVLGPHQDPWRFQSL